MQVFIGEGIHTDLHRLPGLHAGQLGFLEVADHIGVLQRYHRQQACTRIDVGSDAQRTLADHAVDGRDDAGVGQVQLRPIQACLGMLEATCGTVDLSAENVHLLARRGQRGL
ncbi:hypothetical protein D9M71_295700 [compost metagenome]